ncbi:MAG: hypothetical protein ACREQL_09330 [Candidatus Binatia bacterium]
MRVLATLAFLATCLGFGCLGFALADAADQRPDGFGGRNTYHGPSGDRSCDGLGTCGLLGHVRSENGDTVYEMWTCDGGQVILWPIECTDDPQTPCKGI